MAETNKINPSDRDTLMMNSFESPKPETKDRKKSKTKKSRSPDRSKSKEIAPTEKLDELSRSEKAEVVDAVVKDQNQNLREEIEHVKPDTPEEAQVLVDALLLENIQKHTETAEEIDEELIEQAFSETLADLELEEQPDADAGLEGIDDADDEEEDENLLVPVQQTTSPNNVNQPPNTPNNPPPSPPNPPPSPNPSPTPSPSPPPPPPPPPPSPGGPNYYGGPGPNIVTPLANPNAVPLHTETITVIESRRRRGRDLLVGGLVGYLIGRRRGRIKTEEKLLPIQHKLEKEVKTLQASIYEHEEKIRKLTADKLQQTNQPPEKLVADIRLKTELKTKHEAVVMAKIQEVAPADIAGLKPNEIKTDQAEPSPGSAEFTQAEIAPQTPTEAETTKSEAEASQSTDAVEIKNAADAAEKAELHQQAAETNSEQERQQSEEFIANKKAKQEAGPNLAGGGGGFSSGGQASSLNSLPSSIVEPDIKLPTAKTNKQHRFLATGLVALALILLAIILSSS